jgi:phosphate-selective porin
MASFYWDFDAWFVLAAQQVSARHRIAVRYDDFAVDQTREFSPPPWSHEKGNAWTLGWTWAVRDHVEVAAEWLRIDSVHSTRVALGEAPRAVEHSAQVSVKLFL